MKDLKLLFKNRLSVFSVFLTIIFISCEGGRKEKEKWSGGGVKEEEIGEITALVSAQGNEIRETLITRSGSLISEKAVSGAKLKSGDTISAGKGENVMIRLHNGSEIAVDSETDVTFKKVEEINLQKGRIWVNTAMAAGEANPLIHAGSGNIKMEGTIVDVLLAINVLKVSVISGKAKFEGQGREIEVRGGQQVVVERESPPSLSNLKDPANLSSWTEALRRVVLKSLSVQGYEKEMNLPAMGSLTARVPGGSTDLAFEMEKQSVDIKIQENVAVTRIEQIFKNPTHQTVEGTYRFPIPPDGRMTRFDMEINGRMMTGEVVEREKGRRIMQSVINEFYERMRDPALSEWESGSTFKTRIFPIRPGEKKRIVLSYIQTIPGENGRHRYILPLASGLAPNIKQMQIDAEIMGSSGSFNVNTPLYPAKVKARGNKTSISFEAQNFQPAVDFVIEYTREKPQEASLATFSDVIDKGDSKEIGEEKIHSLKQDREWNYFMLTASPEIRSDRIQTGNSNYWIFLVDTSQSRTRVDMQLQKKLLEAIVSHLSREDMVKLITFDTFPVTVLKDWEVASSQLAGKIASVLESIIPAGATKIEGALMEAANQISGQKGVNVVLISDGAATLGENKPSKLIQWVSDVFKEAQSSITTIAIGSSIDRLVLEEISRVTGGRFYSISAGEDIVTGALRLIASLQIPVLRNLHFSFEGLEVKDVYPENIPNLSDGQEVVVTGRFRGTGNLVITLKGSLGEETYERKFSFDVGEGKNQNSFIPLIWASQKIDSLTLKNDPALKKQIVELSKRYTIPSRFTSFIVLENEDMYREFGVKRIDERYEWLGNEEIKYELTEKNEADYRMGVMDLMDYLEGGGGESAWDIAPSAKSVSRSEAPRKSIRGDIKLDSAFEEVPYPHHPYSIHHSKRRYPLKNATIKELPENLAAETKQKRIEELQSAINKDPLLRKNRLLYINFLRRIGDYKTALSEAREWYSMDSSNPSSIVTLANLVLIQGDVATALRIYSGVVDIAPEQKKLMENIAGFYESKGMWQEAYPFRVSLSNIRSSDKKALAMRAMAAVRAGRWDDAYNAAIEVTSKGKDKKIVPYINSKLPPYLSSSIEKIIQGEKPVDLLNQEKEKVPGGAELMVEITWSKNADLDIVITDGSGNLSGMEKGEFIRNGEMGNSEVFYMKKVKKGNYLVKVACWQSGSCGTLSGRAVIKVLGKTKIIPFVVDNDRGTEISKISVHEW